MGTGGHRGVARYRQRVEELGSAVSTGQESSQTVSKRREGCFHGEKAWAGEKKDLHDRGADFRGDFEDARNW